MDLTESEKKLLEYCLKLAYENVSLLNSFGCEIFSYKDTDIGRNEICNLSEKLGIEMW